MCTWKNPNPDFSPITLENVFAKDSVLKALYIYRSIHQTDPQHGNTRMKLYYILICTAIFDHQQIRYRTGRYSSLMFYINVTVNIGRQQRRFSTQLNHDISHGGACVYSYFHCCKITMLPCNSCNCFQWLLKKTVYRLNWVKPHQFSTLAKSACFFSHHVTTHDCYSEGLWLSSRPVRLRDTFRWLLSFGHSMSVCTQWRWFAAGSRHIAFLHQFHVVMGDSPSGNQCHCKVHDYIVHIELFTVTNLLRSWQQRQLTLDEAFVFMFAEATWSYCNKLTRPVQQHKMVLNAEFQKKEEVMFKSAAGSRSYLNRKQLLAIK